MGKKIATRLALNKIGHIHIGNLHYSLLTKTSSKTSPISINKFFLKKTLKQKYKKWFTMDHTTMVMEEEEENPLSLMA